MPRSRVPTTVAVALVLATAAGCGDTGGLESAGATPTAVSPVRLWPELTPASSPAYELGEVTTEVVEGVAVPDDDIRKVDPVAIVRAEIADSPDEYEGAKAPYYETARRMADCDAGGDRARCPVLTPYYRDLSGDGREDLTLGFRLLPDGLTAMRVYTVQKHRLVRVMSYDDAVSAVELAGRSVIVRAPSEVAGYEYRLQWTWDAEQNAMLLTNDEMLRIGNGRPRPSGSSSGSSSGSLPGSSSASPSDSSSGSPFASAP